MFSGSGGFEAKKAVMSRKERREHADEWCLTTLWPKLVIDEICSTTVVIKIIITDQSVNNDTLQW